VVKRDGVGFISIKQGEGEKEDTKTGRWFTYYNQDEFAKVLAKNGFYVSSVGIRQGEIDTWLTFYAVKN
jgi:hypothetical protein